MLLCPTICVYTQKLENRALVVRQIEEPFWKQLSIEYMSEESDDESDALVVVVHQPTWRSKRKHIINVLCLLLAQVLLIFFLHLMSDIIVNGSRRYSNGKKV